MTKTVIVTGATRGIGRAISIQLAKEKYNLVLNYSNDDASAKESEEECRKYHDNIFIFKADVSLRSDVVNMMDETIKKFLTVDVVINNAGINIDKPLISMSESDWDRVVDTNMKGTFLVSQQAAIHMLRQENGGQIINVSATTAIKGRKNGINYCAAKAGIIVMTKCLALELAPKIRVNCVIPGFTWTKETEDRFDLPARLNEELGMRNIPLERLGKPEEIADMVSFLISEKAKYINGQKIIVDGGEFMF
jgi:3-oxoacyl-[acyl-carrier protein] reductase